MSSRSFMVSPPYPVQDSTKQAAEQGWKTGLDRPLLFEGKIVGTREGTILTALLTGFAVKWFVARLEGPLNARLRGEAYREGTA